MHRDNSPRFPGKPINRPLWFVLFWLCAVAGISGAQAAGLVLKDLSGKDRNIKEYLGQGRWAVVVVWSADCPICRREMYHMTFLHEQHKDEGIQVLGLSIDGYEQRSKVQDFVDEQALNFPTLIGDDEDARQLSGRPFLGTPTYYFFAPNGTFMTQHVGALTLARAEQTVERLKKEQSQRR